MIEVTLLKSTETPDESPQFKQARLKVVHQCQSISLGKLAFFHYLERVETLRRFWELKHIELKGEQVDMHTQTLITSNKVEIHIIYMWFKLLNSMPVMPCVPVAILRELLY